MLRVLVTAAVLVGAHAALDAGPAGAAPREAGIQVGGSGFLQGVVRLGVTDRLSVELGGLAITHALDLSAGLHLEPYRRGRFSVYASAGGAVAGAFGPVPDDAACTPDQDCTYVPGGTVLAFGYARAGVRWRFRDGTRAVALDVGGWLGTWSDDQGPDRRRDGWFVAPTAGLGYLWLWP